MHHDARSPGRVTQKSWRESLFIGLVGTLLVAGTLSVAVGTALGLADFRDVGYPDSSTLLKIRQFAESGTAYSDPDLPPYAVTVYGPLMYALFAVPYKFAQASNIAPEVMVRIAVLIAFCVCVLVIFQMSKRLHGSRSNKWLCILLPLSALPLASWTTQLRGDFLALSLSLLSLYWCLSSTESPSLAGAAILAGTALLVKQTFLAVPIAILLWLMYGRRYKQAVVWVMGIALILAGGYAIVWWREPLLLKSLAALQHPVLEFREALLIIRKAVFQPAAPLAVIGGYLALRNRSPEKILFLVYCVVAWLLAILTIPKAGGNINYFWEPLLASAVLAEPGMRELQKKANRTPILIAAILFVLPTLRQDFRYLRISYADVMTYQDRKAKWEQFVSIVSGRRLLSTYPDVTIHGIVPEIPDPYMNSELEIRGLWKSGPVVAQLDAGKYEMVIVREGETEARPNEGYRGIRKWDDAMWGALKNHYRRACVFEGMEVWLPNRSSDETFPGLSRIGCTAAAEH